VTVSKGAHIAVQLPPDCAGQGISTLSRQGEGFTVIPTRGLHSLGPTWTIHEGDPDDIRPLEADIAWLLDEANYLLPGLALKRSDVVFAWAGARPLTYDPAIPTGKKSREIRDLGPEGAPNIMAMTGGPIMTYRSAGTELTRLIEARRPPAGKPQSLAWTSRLPADVAAYAATAAKTEQVETLADLMFRRIGLGWSKNMGAAQARQIAETVAPALNWDGARIDAEVRQYMQYLAEHHAFSPPEGEGTQR